MLRRVKEKVAADLPSKREVLIRCAPSGYQAHLLQLVTDRAWATMAPSDAGGGARPRAVSVNNTIMELVRACIYCASLVLSLALPC
jgi:SNF2 family DNA or RNA helicase